ncbi:MAG: hypothetical protein QM286_08940 [Acidobacteriota bacterium]|nr:hypothetical protein [Acidobacteriota bacterium]
MTTDAPAVAPLTAISGLVTLAWYAMPDLIGSRALRGVLKAGLLGGWLVYAQRSMDADPADLLNDQVWGSREVACGALGLAGVVVGTVAGEEAIFAFGERRRARGLKLAHTAPAFGWAVLSAAAVAVALRKVTPAQ